MDLSSRSRSSATTCGGRACDADVERPRSRGADAQVSTRATTLNRPRVGVVKFASCDGCQLTILDLEDELLALDGPVRVRRVCRGHLAPFFRPVRHPVRRGLHLQPGAGGRDHPPARRGEDPRDHRRMRDGRWHPGAAHRGGARGLPRRRLPRARVRRVARHRVAGRQLRDRRRRAARLPDRSRTSSSSCSRP